MNISISVPEYDRIELRRSKTIQGLGTVAAKVIWEKHEDGPMSKHVWAPEIHFIEGVWYICFAAGTVASPFDHRIYLLENNSENPMEGSWKEMGQIKTNWESFSLDATTFAYNGKRYLLWAQRDPSFYGNSNLYMAEMKNPWTLAGKQVMISKPSFGWEQIRYWVNEGPAVLVRNNMIFITYSASATDHSYCMGLLWAQTDKDLLDPASWKKTESPVFASNEKTGQYGPGHNSFTISEDGKHDVLVYHARNYRKISGDPLYDPNHHTRAQLLLWKQDGFPVFGLPVPDAVK